MKPTQLFLTMSFLLLLAGVGYCQMSTPQPGLNASTDVSETRTSDPGLVRYWLNIEMPILGQTQALMRDSELRALLGVSDEYYQEILATVRDASGHISEHPGYEEAEREHTEATQALFQASGISPHAITPMFQLTPENAAAFERAQAAGRRLESIHSEFATISGSRRHEAFHDALTPELKQKLQDIQLAEVVLGEGTAFDPRVFAALNLVDTQKEQLDQIRKELETEFLIFRESLSEPGGIMFRKSEATAHEAARISREAERRGEGGPEAINAVRTKLLMEDPEYQKALAEVLSGTRAFASLFTTRMFDILNGEQRRRLQNLIENPPPHVRFHLNRLREQRGESARWTEGEGTGGDRDIWLPGPDSWRPGDPLPERYWRNRNLRGTFPRPVDSR